MIRRLMLIPIVHSEKEMGSLKSDISDMIDRKFGKEKRDQHRKDVALFWDNLRTIIQAVLANLDGTLIRIYQDGIPIGGEIGAKLIAMGAQDGIPNHQIVLSIIEHGGVLEKTESPAGVGRWLVSVSRQISRFSPTGTKYSVCASICRYVEPIIV